MTKYSIRLILIFGSLSVITIYIFIKFWYIHLISPAILNKTSLFFIADFFIISLPIILCIYYLTDYFHLKKNTEIKLKELEVEQVEVEQFLVLGRLSASIAHEVRNPLNNILLLTDELNSPDDSQNIVEIAKRLKRNAERINHAVELVYRLARPGEARQRLESQDFCDVVMLFDTLKDQTERDGRELAITNKTGRKRVYLSGDYDCLQTIFENLLRNAMLASSQETAIYVDISEDAKNKQYYVVIYNEGKLPDSFKIATIEDLSSRDAHVHGLGLGVVIVNELAKQMNLRISYHSADGVVSFQVVGKAHHGIFERVKGIDEKDDFFDGSVPRIDS